MTTQLIGATHFALTEQARTLQAEFNSCLTSNAPTAAVLKIYDALLAALSVLEIAPRDHGYLKMMLEDYRFDDCHTLRETIRRQQEKIRQSGDENYPADDALRALFAVLRTGVINYPMRKRSRFEKLFRRGKISAGERLRFEAEKLETVARHLTEIVSFYDARNCNFDTVH